MGDRFLNPWGVAVDASGNVYVVDKKNHRIQKFGSDGTFKLALGANVDASGATPDVCEDAAKCQTGRKLPFQVLAGVTGMGKKRAFFQNARSSAFSLAVIRCEIVRGCYILETAI